MGNEKSRFLKRDDGTIYDSLTSVTWMANDSRLDMDKEVSYAETEEYLKKINEIEWEACGKCWFCYERIYGFGRL